MFDKSRKGLNSSQLMRISGKNITIKFSENFSLLGRIKPIGSSQNNRFEFVFRQHPSIRTFEYILGSESTNSNDSEFLKIKKEIVGGYYSFPQVISLPSKVYLNNGRGRYKELDSFLKSS
jgi:hypothetical protein